MEWTDEVNMRSGLKTSILVFPIIGLIFCIIIRNNKPSLPDHAPTHIWKDFDVRFPVGSRIYFTGGQWGSEKAAANTIVVDSSSSTGLVLRLYEDGLAEIVGDKHNR
jgi:hypothetical protein